MSEKFDKYQPIQYVNIMEYPYGYILKTLLRKIKRRILLSLGISPPETRMVWNIAAVSDADGATANVRNYIEQLTLRRILKEFYGGKTLKRACEIGCGYGRVIMVLKEFADQVKGFEREPELVETAAALLPDVEFERIETITNIPDTEPFDFAMTSTILQHLTDDDARGACRELRRMVPAGYVLLIEKTEEYRVSENQTDGTQFLSRARPVETYEEFMAPYKLVKTYERVVETTYSNPKPGMCMLFKSE